MLSTVLIHNRKFTAFLIRSLDESKPNTSEKVHDNGVSSFHLHLHRSALWWRLCCEIESGNGSLNIFVLRIHLRDE
jgi:hypothetical protein